MPRSAFHVARTTSTKFATITKDPDTVYWLTDTKQLFLGSVEYVPADIATKQYVDKKVEESSTINVDDEDYKLEFQVIDGSPCLITTKT